VYFGNTYARGGDGSSGLGNFAKGGFSGAVNSGNGGGGAEYRAGGSGGSGIVIVTWGGYTG
jgi:hypothetical protein